MEDFSCCSLHLECSAKGKCVVEKGLMADRKEEMEAACFLAKRLPLNKPVLEPIKEAIKKTTLQQLSFF